MPIPPGLLPSPDCSNCQYRPLGKFANSSPDAMADFNAVGRMFSLPTGITLNQEGVAGDRVMVICRGQVKRSCISKRNRILNLKMASPGDVHDLHTATPECLLEVTEVTAETFGPTSVNMIRRADFLAFLDCHGNAGMNAEKSFAEVQICFLGCSRADFAWICSWSSQQPSKSESQRTLRN